MNIIEEYERHLNNIGYSTNYIPPIKTFLEFLATKNVNYENIDYEHISEYISYLKYKGNSNNTINFVNSSIKHFYKYLYQYKDIDRLEVIVKIKKLRAERKVSDYITKEELDDMIEMGVDFIPRINPIKLKAFMYFWFYTGLRRSELLNLKRENINLSNKKCGLVKVVLPTKNCKERIIPFPNKIKKILKEYFKLEEEKNNAFNMTLRKLLYLFNDLDDFVPNKHLNPHVMRHSFARMLARNKIGIKAAQKLLGHSNLSTTEIYYDIDESTIIDMYAEKVK